MQTGILVHSQQWRTEYKSGETWKRIFLCPRVKEKQHMSPKSMEINFIRVGNTDIFCFGTVILSILP
jgi:hypothetical protein